MAKDGSYSGKATSMNVFAVQCGTRFKWRVIPTQEEFEDIRSTFIEDSYICNNDPGISCDDPADIEFDSTRTWIMDKPNTPKTPDGFQRKLTLRKDFSRLDVMYIAPNGNRLRASTEVLQFLHENPEYEHVSVSDFSFTSPKVMQETVPGDVERKASASSAKRSKITREDNEV